MAMCYQERIEKIVGNYRYSQRDAMIFWASDQQLQVGYGVAFMVKV